MNDYIKNISKMKNAGLKRIKPDRPSISIGMGTCGIGNGAEELYEAFETGLKGKKGGIILRKTGCLGY